MRALKDEASAILRRVQAGESVTVTDRGRPVAMLVPIPAAPEEEIIRHLAAAGRVSWRGGKPLGSSRPAVMSGPSVADAVIEDRR